MLVFNCLSKGFLGFFGDSEYLVFFSSPRVSDGCSFCWEVGFLRGQEGVSSFMTVMISLVKKCSLHK